MITRKTDDGSVILKAEYSIDDAVQRLHQYEETMLTPEAMAAVASAYKDTYISKLEERVRHLEAQNYALRSIKPGIKN